MENEVATQPEEKLPAEVRANMLSGEKSIFFNVALFEQTQRVATMFANSTMVPSQFRGNTGNCMIALNYSFRLQADPFMVFQCLYEIKGRPAIEGKLVEAIINQSGKYSEPLQYEWLDPQDKPVERHTVLTHKGSEAFGCQAYSTDAKSGKRVDGPKITWELVKAEGWYSKDGSKWRTMPEMMFYYRAASWFGNKNCPELKLGMHTVEEVEDIVELKPGQNGSFGIPTDAVTALNEKIKAGGNVAGPGPYEIKKEPEAQKPETKSALSEQEQVIYDGWKNLKKVDTLRKQEELSQPEMLTWSPELKKLWSKKWEDKTGEPYEFKEAPEEEKQEDRGQEHTEDEDPNPPIMLNCPVTGEKASLAYCMKKCPDRENGAGEIICLTYMKYMEKNGD